MRRLIPILLFVGACLGPAQAETLDEAVHALGRRVMVRLGAPERLTVQTRAVAPVAAAERDRVDRGLRETLGRWAAPAGAGASAAAQVRVTVTAALAHHVLVAEFNRGDEQAILMAEYDALEAAAPRAPRALPRLERSLLWEQDDRLLDAAICGGGDGDFWVLDTEHLTLRDRLGEVRRQISVRRADAPWPRDVRGRLSTAGGEARASLPGWECRESGCAPGTAGWPVANGFDAAPAGQNEFISPAAPGGGVRFYSAARVSPAALVLSGVDGKLHWSEPAVVGARDRQVEAAWGSELAALPNPCGAGPALLLISARDGQALGAFEVLASSRGVRPAGDGMNLPGTLLALWAVEGDASATAVVRTPAGRYAAYRVFAGCGR